MRFSVNYRLIPLDDEFNNPNAPTGKALPLQSIRKILEKNDDLISEPGHLYR